MKVDYKKCFKKSLTGILIGIALIVINLITCYIIFGNEGYLYEITQYENISNLIIRSIFISLSYIILLFAVHISENIDELIRELSFKKYFSQKMLVIIILLLYGIISFISVDKFIKDKIFVGAFIVDFAVFILIKIIIMFFYKLILETKINQKLKNKNI